MHMKKLHCHFWKHEHRKVVQDRNSKLICIGLHANCKSFSRTDFFLTSFPLIFCFWRAAPIQPRRQLFKSCSVFTSNTLAIKVDTFCLRALSALLQLKSLLSCWRCCRRFLLSHTFYNLSHTQTYTHINIFYHFTLTQKRFGGNFILNPNVMAIHIRGAFWRKVFIFVYDC